MSGFGFIEYEDAMDARDVVPGELFFSSSLEVLVEPVTDYIGPCSISYVALCIFDNSLSLTHRP